MAKDTVEVTVTRKVKIITPKGKYTNHPYLYAIPTSNSTRLPVTGQTDVVKWRETRIPRANGGEDVVWVPDKDLTKLSASDKRTLQMGESPYIINPAEHILLRHGYVYDDSYISSIKREEGEDDVEVQREYVNPKDHAELTAIQLGSESPVAKSKSSYNKHKHNFYIEDKELESQEELNKIDLAFEAEQFIRNDFGTGRYREAGTFLTYSVPEYKSTTDLMSDTRLKAFIMKACREHPDVVLKLKGANAVRIIFLLKLITLKIITRDRNMHFVYGDIFLGETLDGVIDWMNNPNHNSTVTKWQRNIDTREGAHIEIDNEK